MKQRYSHFCFCLGLRPGVVISSFLWLIEGVVLSALLITSLIKNKEEEITTIYYYICVTEESLSITLSAYFIILSLISTFGLASVLVYKSTRLLRMYSYTSWFFTVFIHFVLSIVSIVAMITRKDAFISYRNVIRNNHDNADDVKYQLIWSFVVLFFQGFLYIYFSVILRTYVELCAQVERKQRQFNVSSKRRKIKSSNKSNKSIDYSVYNIKVDKTFDDRVDDDDI